ncbi:hypothetical protein RHMOL_Rhmol08G0077800 [Rhododendron molle]|uniref:Uncharacterized protein n=1 Tax=Rhododendron molle TaxID=49168 RepID=A0ACC0MM31_RHOML|nr:hypothetical protein RHMOL_Rhmol08G0077800 [Rhododendron molle]
MLTQNEAEKLWFEELDPIPNSGCTHGLANPRSWNQTSRVSNEVLIWRFAQNLKIQEGYMHSMRSVKQYALDTIR